MPFWPKRKKWKLKPVPIKEPAFAKINLCLHITGQRADGYHLLDSIVAFANFGDVIEVTENNQMKFSIDGPFKSGLSNTNDNLVLCAANALSSNKTADIKLQKNLPVASGIGGGSADAAAALRALSKLWSVDIMDEMAQGLGADVPVCLASKSQRMQGIGEILIDISCLSKIPAVLVNPGHQVSTPDVFQRLTEKTNTAVSNIPSQAMNVCDSIVWLKALRNDLQTPAISLEPSIAVVIDALQGVHAEMARMSGSGATCFGLFSTAKAANLAAQALIEKHPNWWVKSVILS